jgi:hypothetical protein
MSRWPPPTSTPDAPSGRRCRSVELAASQVKPCVFEQRCGEPLIQRLVVDIVHHTPQLRVPPSFTSGSTVAVCKQHRGSRADRARGRSRLASSAVNPSLFQARLIRRGALDGRAGGVDEGRERAVDLAGFLVAAEEVATSVRLIPLPRSLASARSRPRWGCRGVANTQGCCRGRSARPRSGVEVGRRSRRRCRPAHRRRQRDVLVVRRRSGRRRPQCEPSRCYIRSPSGLSASSMLPDAQRAAHLRSRAAALDERCR